jgi:hypothetical protein
MDSADFPDLESLRLTPEMEAAMATAHRERRRAEHLVLKALKPLVRQIVNEVLAERAAPQVPGACKGTTT